MGCIVQSLLHISVFVPFKLSQSRIKVSLEAAASAKSRYVPAATVRSLHDASGWRRPVPWQLPILRRFDPSIQPHRTCLGLLYNQPRTESFNIIIHLYL